MKILVAIMNNRAEINVRFVQSLIEMFSYTGSKGHKLGMTFFDNCDIATMRNDAVMAAMTKDVDYVLFLDADMIYPHDTIVRLLAHDKDVVQGFYSTRKPPVQSVHFKEIYEDARLAAPENRIVHTTGLITQACGGFGGVLVKKSVFEKMKFPFFKVYFTDDHILVGEDIYFFIKLRELGIISYLDCDLKYGHIINGAIYPDGQVTLL